ncbi:DUF4307 domain-containing protein [Nocardiopsis composta]|uniref:DUF4307 domain-containing protein n=1 Tax=Nocardiopsis composta TaxID=157465 RepID=A0A7W8QQB6_9ACTN|nr:DUF4307 domain-containing protein [Nocardiopsis composta]MBB5434524.1 hypothetical protein [Nocardiopsis composta]
MPESPSDLTSDGAAGAAAPGGDERGTRSAMRRYGGKPFIFLIGLIAAGIFTLGWGAALVSYGDGGGVAKQTVAWSVEDSSTASITFQVSSGDPVTCLVRAYDRQHVEVGQKDVEVGAGTKTVTTEIETVREAAMVEVASCREQGTTK